MKLKNMIRHGAHGILTAALALAVCAGSFTAALPLTAHAEDYTYMATFYAGNHGKFTSRADVLVDNSKTQSSYSIERSPDGSRITVRDLRYGDVVRLDAAADGAVDMAADSLYYVKGIRDSGLDNAEAGYGAFSVRRDVDFVVAYGMKAEQTSYTVYYKSLDGKTLAEPRTYWGNVGDKPVVAYVYVEGYTPLSYNLTKTLSEDPAQNDMTFLYKESDGETVTIKVPGPVEEIHVPGGSTTVTVPGPTIVQNPPSGGNNQTGGQIGNTQNPSGGNDQAGGNSQTGTDQSANNGQTGGSNQTGGNSQQGGNNQNNSNNGQTGGNDQQNQNGGGQPDNSQGNNGQTGGDQNNGGTPSGNVDISGTGAHGQRPDGQPSGATDNTGNSSSSTGSEYKPGGSLDVVISSDYEPSDLVDLDENPSGVPLAPDPTGSDTDPATGENNGTDDGAGDPVADGMNENTDGTGTGTMEPEKGGFPVIPVVIGVIVVLGAAAGGIFAVYKKQQASDAGEDGE